MSYVNPEIRDAVLNAIANLTIFRHEMPDPNSYPYDKFTIVTPGYLPMKVERAPFLPDGAIEITEHNFYKHRCIDYDGRYFFMWAPLP